MSNHQAPAKPAYIRDAYLKEFSTRVVQVSGQALILEDTIFYPTGGGQPGDSGWVSYDGKKYSITNTRRCRETSQIIHELESDEIGLKPGDSVQLTLNWDRRYAHMRLHSCMHLLCSLIPAGVTGGGLTDTKARLDFCLGDAPLPDKQELTGKLNCLINKNMPVSIEILDEKVLDEQPELVRTMSVQPPRGTGQLRMIRIQDTDFQPCGGTHVRSTAEIGRVRIAKVESKGKNNKRVQIVFD